jgi:serine/threonine-protein kinase
MAEGEGTLAGSRVGAYQLGKLIGAGQLAEVYQAEHPAIPQPVALKIFMLVAAANTAYMGAMHDIASRVQLLKADYILPIHGFGQEGKLLYLSMPLMYESLRSILQRTGYLPLYRAVALLRQIATGLAAAHAADIIHRDLKPENVLLNVAGQGFVSNFGVGRDLSPESVERRSLGTLSSLIGTPAYMAPEQLRGQPADQRADVYALGVIFYEMLTGAPPYSGNTIYDVAAKALAPTPRDACPNTPHHWASEYAGPDRDPQADLTARAKADRHARARPHGNRDGNHFSHSNRYANAMRI